MVKQFNAAGNRVGRKAIVVKASHGNSGEQLDQLKEGKIKPDLWSPGDESWLELASSHWKAVKQRELFDSSSPLVEHPARDHDVGADGAGAGVSGEAARLARHRQGRRHARGVGRLRSPGVGEVPVGPRPPRRQLRLPRGDLRGLRRARQDRRDHPRGSALAARHRVPEGFRGRGRALRPVQQLDRRPDARQGAGLPLRRGAVREHDHREQREARQQALQARGDLPPRGERLDPAPHRDSQGGVGDRREARGGAAVPRLPAGTRGAGRRRWSSACARSCGTCGSPAPSTRSTACRSRSTRRGLFRSPARPSSSGSAISGKRSRCRRPSCWCSTAPTA